MLSFYFHPLRPRCHAGEFKRGRFQMSHNIFFKHNCICANLKTRGPFHKANLGLSYNLQSYLMKFLSYILILRQIDILGTNLTWQPFMLY